MPKILEEKRQTKNQHGELLKKMAFSPKNAGEALLTMAKKAQSHLPKDLSQKHDLYLYR